ncbi:hypothetical protein [uncultured Acinetobacter sp.]|uniref:hypothetical protein n=1 Tax=uncultured Acinetobacter sp. TaxID=165433 RepID=UPI0026231F13|nr:hypothetical protein [uncultured Acinetobacter sp.]
MNQFKKLTAVHHYSKAAILSHISTDCKNAFAQIAIEGEIAVNFFPRKDLYKEAQVKLGLEAFVITFGFIRIWLSNIFKKLAVFIYVLCS